MRNSVFRTFLLSPVTCHRSPVLMNVNKVILVGRLTRDPEVRSTATGQNVASIGIATSRAYTDKNGQKQEQTEFHNLVLWGRLAEIAGQYLIKGQECYFEGRLQTQTYTGKDGVERKKTDVVVENMQMGSKPQGSAYRQGPATGSVAPASASAVTASSATAPQQNKPAGNNAPASKEEELPTINLDDEKDEIRIEDVPF